MQFVGTSARADTTVSSTAEVVLPDDSAVMEPDAVDLSAVVDVMWLCVPVCSSPKRTVGV